MNEPRFDTVAVVLGMHRSGTSALAGMLGLTGFDAPRTLLPSSSVNERGFWESEPTNALNDRLLANLGTTWYGLGPIFLDAMDKRRARAAQTHAEKVLRAEFDQGSRPLVKDPRLCRLLPLWQPAFANLSRRTIYVIALRSPVEVAQSLNQRNEFDQDLSLLLWARYYLDAEFHTRGLPRIVISYDQLLEDWPASFEALTAELNLQLRLTSAKRKKVDGFLSKSLRHHWRRDEKALADLERLPIVQQTYSVLFGWAKRAKQSEADFVTLDRAREQLDGVSGTLATIVENARLDQKRLASAKVRTDEIADELERARKALAELGELRASFDKQSFLQAKLEERVQSAVAALTTAIQERSALDEMAANALRAREALADELSRVRAEAQIVAEQYRHERAELLDQFESKLAERERSRAEEERNHSLRIEQFEQDLRTLKSEQEADRQELKDVKRKYRSTQHQLSRDGEKLRRTQERLAATEQDLERIRQSFAWRTSHVFHAALNRGAALLRAVVGLGDRKLRYERARLIRSSSWFDPNWYLARYHDVASAGIDPALHYLENGWREGRDPGPLFSTAAYLRSNSDVARANLNPLLHFIEFGYSEGRSIAELAARLPSPVSDMEFEPAMRCASFPSPEKPPVRWRRSARLRDRTGELLIMDGEPIGFIADTQKGAALKLAFDQLALLSGYAKASAKDFDVPWPPSSQRLADAWFVTNGRLRTRWHADGDALVIRAYQHDQSNDGKLLLVGEGLALSKLDLIDANLANRYFPLLFVFADPDGTVRNVELFSFPALVRGGAYYAELLALERSTSSAEARGIDAVAQAGVFAEQLRAIICRSVRPLIGKLAVDLEGANGTEHLFQPDFQQWLSAIARVGMEPLGGKNGPRGEYLAGLARLPVEARESGGTLILPADTIPSLSILLASEQGGDSAGHEVLLPMLVAGTEPAQPAILIELPAFSASALTVSAPDYPSAWVRFIPDAGSGFPEHSQAAAIRHPKRAALSDPELLVPVAEPALPVSEKDKPITWLVFPEDWESEMLGQALEALSRQETAMPLALALVGELDPATLSLAQRLFHDRVTVSADITSALDRLETPLAGYLGAQVILHDSRTSRLLAMLLEDPAMVSASCVLICAEKRGKGWHVFVADSGTIGTGGGQGQSIAAEQCSQILWRATYPVARPPRDLWVARSSSISGWLQRAGPLRAEEGFQACTSLVTASYAERRSEGQAHLAPPAASNVRTLRAEVLFG